MEEYREKYDFPNVGIGYVNGLNSNNSSVDFSVNFQYKGHVHDLFVTDIIPSTRDLNIARAGLEGFAKAAIISAGLRLVPFDNENWLGIFYVGYPRPSAEEVMKDI